MLERCSHYHFLIVLTCRSVVDRKFKHQHIENVYEVIQVHLKLFVNRGTFNLGIFPSKYRINSPTIYIIVVYVQCRDKGEQIRNYPDNTELMTTCFKIIRLSLVVIHASYHEEICFRCLPFLP